MATSPNQCLYVLDEHKHVIFANQPSGGGCSPDISTISLKEGSFDWHSPEGDTYSISQASSKTKFTFVSITPRSSLNQVPFQLLTYTVWIVLLSFGIGLIVTGLLTWRSSLLKYSLNTPGRIVPLSEEIAYTQLYMEIQKIRFPDRLDFIWQYEEEDLKDLGMMKMLLLPLLENCLQHGLREKAGRGFIKIKLLRVSNYLRIAGIVFAIPPAYSTRSEWTYLYLFPFFIIIQNKRNLSLGKPVITLPLIYIVL